MSDVSIFEVAGEKINVKDAIARPIAEYAKPRIPYKEGLTNGVYIMIGDSYLAGQGATTNWGKEMASLLELGTNQYATFANGGAGFNVSGNSFATLLSKSNSPTGNNADVTHLIVAGGYNDDNNVNGIYTAISDFIAGAKSKYPNADIFVSYIANNILEPYETLGDALGYYCDASIRNGAHFIDGVYLLLYCSEVMQSDGFHPNNSGQRRIAGGLINGLEGQGINVTQNPRNVNLVNPKTGVSNIYNNGSNNWQVNGMFTFNTFGFGADLNWTDTWNGNTEHEFCEMTGNQFKGCNGGQSRVCQPAIVSADGTWYVAPTEIIFKKGVISLRIYLLRDDKTNYFTGHINKIIIPGFTTYFDFIKN